MEMPSVDNLAIDEARNIKFNVRAYRKLSADELVMAVRYYLSQCKRKPKKNTEVTIVSLLGQR